MASDLMARAPLRYVGPKQPSFAARRLAAAIVCLSIWPLLCNPCFAGPVSQSYPCLQGREQKAVEELQKFGNRAITSFFKIRNIDVDPSAIQFKVSVNIQNDTASPPYAAFTGGAGANAGISESTLAGSVAAKDGTKFNILLSSGSDQQNTAEYRILASQNRFDKEGNAINGHCRLQLFNLGDGSASRNLLILNALSGHVLGLISLPTELSLY
jgi:hypothetical protein